MHSNNEPENLKRTVNLYFNLNYNSLYNFNSKEETFSNTKDTKIKSYTTQAKTVAQCNQKTKRVPKIKITKTKIPETNPFVN